MGKKVLLFSRDPGGANVIIPIVRPLIERGYEVMLFGKDIALSRYLKSGLFGDNIMDYVNSIEESEIKAFLKEHDPDFIITGTSADDMTEKLLWKAAEIMGIPSFAIIDQWMNYGVRFSNYGVSELTQYSTDKTHPFMPTKILVMDEYAYNEAIKDGLEPSRIVISGQPHFERLLQYKGRSLDESINALRNRLKDESSVLVTYASEPLSKHYRGDDDATHYWGYTEKTVFAEIISALESILHDQDRRVTLFVKLHPKEDSDSYNDVVNQHEHSKIDIIVDKESDPWDLILASDLICGMSSMFLLEAVILGKPVMSVQIGLSKENPFILDRIGLLKSILNRETLLRELRQAIIENKPLKYAFRVIDNPVANVISHMENNLCPN